MLDNFLGKPAVSFVGLQRMYDRYKDDASAVFKKDRAWFAAHPQSLRVIRAAMADEFNHSKAKLNYFGRIMLPPQLWVCVEKRCCDAIHSVMPVYRGKCFWNRDAGGYASVDESKDETGNYAIDTLLFRMYQMDGVNLMEMLEYTAKVAEVEQAQSKQAGSVH